LGDVEKAIRVPGGASTGAKEDPPPLFKLVRQASKITI
jgi:hypothetical protein